MDYARFTKKLRFPEGFKAPHRLAHGGLVATAISRDDLADDVRGINASLDLINATRGGGWPNEPVSEAFNFVDLVWHELEFREQASLTYVVRTAGGDYVGCCYFYPLGRRTPLTEDLAECDVDVSWWVVPAAYARGDYVALHAALIAWLSTDFPFWKPYFSNLAIPDT